VLGVRENIGLVSAAAPRPAPGGYRLRPPRSPARRGVAEMFGSQSSEGGRHLRIPLWTGRINGAVGLQPPGLIRGNQVLAVSCHARGDSCRGGFVSVHIVIALDHIFVAVSLGMLSFGCLSLPGLASRQGFGATGRPSKQDPVADNTETKDLANAAEACPACASLR
jgi:hypothetical protein